MNQHLRPAVAFRVVLVGLAFGVGLIAEMKLPKLSLRVVLLLVLLLASDPAR